MNNRTLAAASLLTLLAGCASTSNHEPPPVPPGAVTLNDGQVRDTLVGKKFYGTTRMGYPYSLAFAADGTDVFSMSTEQPVAEKWTLNNGTVCLIMKDYPTECSQVKMAEGAYWFVDPNTGKVNSWLRLNP